MRFFKGLSLLCLFAVFPNYAAVVLQYHHVSNETPPSTTISPDDFSEHMAYLKSQDFEIVPLSKILQAVKQGETIDPNWIAITFDDGYHNVLEHAHPVLAEYNWPYTIFVNPDLVDGNSKGYLSWQELNDMAKAGAEIANHSAKHDHLVRQHEGESKSDWLNRIKEDLLKSEHRIDEMTGQNHRMMAYPFGEYDHELQQLLRDIDMMGIGQHSGAVGATTDLTRVPRFPANGVYANLNTLKTKLRTLAFSIESINISDEIVDENPPRLSLTIDTTDLTPSAIRCYFGSDVLVPTWPAKNTFEVISTKKLQPGRGRYNCTAPSLSQPGYFYWFSQPWMVKNADGSWYAE